MSRARRRRATKLSAQPVTRWLLLVLVAAHSAVLPACSATPRSEDDPVARTRQCRGERAAGCNRSALESLERAPRNDPATQLLAAACHEGYPPACNNYAIEAWERLRDPAGEKSRSSTTMPAAVLGRGCRLGDATACVNRELVSALDGERRPIDVAQLESACEAGHPTACFVAGAARFGFPLGGDSPSRSSARDDAKADSLFARACEGGSADGCLARALAIRLERAAVADPEEAERLFERACNGGATLACYELGLSGGTDTLARLQFACDRNVRPSCIALARRIPRYDEHAVAGALAEACTQRRIEACDPHRRTLPELQYDWEGALGRLDEACAEGDVEACGNGDVVYLFGDCQKGNTDACHAFRSSSHHLKRTP